MLCGLIYLLGPWSKSGPRHLDANPGQIGELDGRAEVAPAILEGNPAEAIAQFDAEAAVQRRVQDTQGTPTESGVEGKWIRGRLIFPVGVEVPADAQVYAFRDARMNPRETRARLAELMRTGQQRAERVDADGRFRLQIPSLDPRPGEWVFLAGATGWVRSHRFPNPRPLGAAGPAPEEEFELDMVPVFAASFELVTPTGARPKLNRSLVRASGGPGLSIGRGWGVRGPLAADSPTALLSVPSGLPQVVGGHDSSIGLVGPELAIQYGSVEDWSKGELIHQYVVELPGYERIEKTLRFGPLAHGDVPHYRFELRPLESLGDLRLQFDRAAWWNRELDPHGAAELKLRAHRLDGPEGGAQGDWEMDLPTVPSDGVLRLEAIPMGHYRLELIASNSKVSLPLSPAEVRIPEAGLAQTRVDCGGLGAVQFSIAEGCAGEWSSGLLEFLALDQNQMRSFRSEQWPVFLGPLPVAESSVILLRSLDRKTPPQVADRLNHSDEFEIVDGVTTRYSLQGVL